MGPSDPDDGIRAFSEIPWRENYARWRAKIYCDPHSPPTEQQKLILEAVHYRQVLEHQHAGHRVNLDELSDAVPVPLLRLVHGLPGSGKTVVLLWLVSYLKEVWHMEQDEDFAVIAPLNSMASNINGSTVHSFGAIAFCWGWHWWAASTATFARRFFKCPALKYVDDFFCA